MPVNIKRALALRREATILWLGVAPPSPAH